MLRKGEKPPEDEGGKPKGRGGSNGRTDRARGRDREGAGPMGFPPSLDKETLTGLVSLENKRQGLRRFLNRTGMNGTKLTTIKTYHDSSNENSCSSVSPSVKFPRAGSETNGGDAPSLWAPPSPSPRPLVKRQRRRTRLILGGPPFTYPSRGPRLRSPAPFAASLLAPPAAVKP